MHFIGFMNNYFLETNEVFEDIFKCLGFKIKKGPKIAFWTAILSFFSTYLQNTLKNILYSKRRVSFDYIE